MNWDSGDVVSAGRVQPKGVLLAILTRNLVRLHSDHARSRRIISDRKHRCKMGGDETALTDGQPGVCSCTVPALRIASIASCVVSS